MSTNQNPESSGMHAPRSKRAQRDDVNVRLAQAPSNPREFHVAHPSTHER